MTRYTEFVAPHKVGFFFRISLLLLNRICSNIAQSTCTREIKLFWWCKRYSAIWSNSREHSKNVLLSV